MVPNAVALPIVPTLLDVARLCWGERRLALRYALVPLAVMAAFDLAGTLGGINVLNDQGWLLAATVAGLVAFAPLTVTWYRALVNGPASADRRPLFTIGFSEWAVIRINVLITLIVMIVFMVAAALVGGAGALVSSRGGFAVGAMMVLVGAPVLFTIGVIITRLTLALAYAALDRETDLRTIWDISRGFSMRLTVLHALCVLAVVALAQLGAVVIDAAGDAAGVLDEENPGGWALGVSISTTIFNIIYLLVVSALFAVTIRKIDDGQLGTGAGLLIHSDRAALKGEMQQALAFLDKIRAEGSKATMAEFRSLIDKFGSHFPLPAGTTTSAVDAGGVPATWVLSPDAATDRVVLYLHGGGFWAGSSISHARAAADIGVAAQCRVLVPDYRLAPEHPFPAAVDDCVAAYRWLLGTGVDSKRIALVGDSAGGGLVISTLLKARDLGLPQPAAGVCLSPWVDLACDHPSYTIKQSEDPLASQASLKTAALSYLGAADPRTPLASPVFAELTGLPPLLIQVGSREVLLGDAVALAARARHAGVTVQLQQWPGMIHNWHLLADLLGDGRRANAEIGAFLRAVWTT